MTRNCHIYENRVSKSHAEPFHMQLCMFLPPANKNTISEAVPAPLRHVDRVTPGQAYEEEPQSSCMPTNSCSLVGWWREEHRWNWSNVSWVGADLSQFKGLHHGAANFFLLRTAGAFPDIPFVFLYPNLQWSKNLIRQHPCQQHLYRLPQAPRSCWLNDTAHTGQDPAGTIKSFKVKYIHNCFPESNPE